MRQLLETAVGLLRRAFDFSKPVTMESMDAWAADARAFLADFDALASAPREAEPACTCGTNAQHAPWCPAGVGATPPPSGPSPETAAPLAIQRDGDFVAFLKDPANPLTQEEMEALKRLARHAAEARPLTEGERTAEQERADVVAWLRRSRDDEYDQAEAAKTRGDLGSYEAWHQHALCDDTSATCIEEGHHVGASPRKAGE